MFLFERNMTFSENETLFFVLTWGKVEQLNRSAQSADPLFSEETIQTDYKHISKELLKMQA
jgi:hypothetical protein